MTTTSTGGADLTDFGFTATESRVYFCLLARGPSSGYGLARELSLARANAYQALRGLVAKGAAVVVGERPQRFRAVRRDTLYTQIVERQTRKLDELETHLATLPRDGAEPVVSLGNERALVELATRLIVREGGEVTCMAPASLLMGLVPALRKRLADGASTVLWSIGEAPQLPIAPAGVVEPSRAERLFGSAVAIVLAGDAAVLTRIRAGEVRGLWATDPLVAGAARATVEALTGAGPA